MKKRERSFLFFALFSMLLLVVSCGGEKETAPAGDEAGKAKIGGVFADVIEALDAEDQKPPEVAFERGEMTKAEWKLFVRARNRLYVPIETYDYYYSDDEYGDEESGDGTDVKSLDDILTEEREEYGALRKSLTGPAEGAESASTPTIKGSPYDGTNAAVEEKLETFFADLPTLMENTPESKREKVVEIVCLRFSNILLKNGILPESFPAEPLDK
jgi:hypothetical protein